MPIHYECDRCGAKSSTKGEQICISSLGFMDHKLDPVVKLCKSCEAPFIVFFKGFLSKTNKNFRFDANREKVYN